MDRKRLIDILEKFKKCKVGVLGDFYVDRYGEGEFMGVSRETGDKILKLKWHRFSPGGASNIAWNLADIGVKTYAFTVLGEDYFKLILLNELEKLNINTDFVFFDRERKTGSFEKIKGFSKNRFVREVRLDADNFKTISKATENIIKKKIPEILSKVDALIVADYNEAGGGIINAGIFSELNRISKITGKPILATSRLNNKKFNGEILVLNDYEAVSAVTSLKFDKSIEIKKEDTLNYGFKLMKKNNNTVFVTRGKHGIMVLPKDTIFAKDAVFPKDAVFLKDAGVLDVPTAKAEKNIDITGAGDSAISAIASSLSAGADYRETAQIANMASYITIHKINTTGTAKPSELVRVYDGVFMKLYGGT